MAAVVEVVLAELLHQLEVVETVSQRHGLLEADICSARGGVRHTQGRGGDSKDQAGRREKDKELFRFKKRTRGENEPTFPSSVCAVYSVSF